MSGVRFIDSDGHIQPNSIWEQYLEPKFRSEMPRIYTGYYGRGFDGQEQRPGIFQ
jgi:hypothetical protein